MSLSSAIRRSDRKAAQILGVDLTRDHAATPKTRPSFVGVLKRRFGRRNSRIGSPEEDDAEECLVWDVLNPFAPPDPALAYVRALMEAEISRNRRYESVGPLDSVHETSHVDYHRDDGHEADDEDDVDDSDEDDEDNDGDEDHDDDEVDVDKSGPIALPCLLPIPLRSIPSPPPPTPSPSSDEDPSAPWADLTQAYNDITIAEERARKAKRDANRSRAKALAILGPEASIAL